MLRTSLIFTKINPIYLYYLSSAYNSLKLLPPWLDDGTMLARFSPFFPRRNQFLRLVWSRERLLPFQSFGPDAVLNIPSVVQPIKIVAVDIQLPVLQ